MGFMPEIQGKKRAPTGLPSRFQVSLPLSRKGKHHNLCLELSSLEVQPLLPLIGVKVIPCSLLPAWNNACKVYRRKMGGWMSEWNNNKGACTRILSYLSLWLWGRSKGQTARTTGVAKRVLPRLWECFRQVEAELISNSSNKIHQTWLAHLL